ncbi:MAG: hypothetical protein HY359_03235 [Candidatus Rokubacteria bacterium]|nr:hypothetical protein [Candidatus Rokubacteria bacterium]
MTRIVAINWMAKYRGATPWLLATAAAFIVLALLAGYWVFHCADGAMTPEFCATMLTSVVLVLLARPLLSGWLTLEAMPAVASVARCRFYRPPELSRV